MVSGTSFVTLGCNFVLTKSSVMCVLFWRWPCETPSCLSHPAGEGPEEGSGHHPGTHCVFRAWPGAEGLCGDWQLLLAGQNPGFSGDRLARVLTSEKVEKKKLVKCAGVWAGGPWHMSVRAQPSRLPSPSPSRPPLLCAPSALMTPLPVRCFLLVFANVLLRILLLKCTHGGTLR